ncbi:MAG: hypothetical protein IT209_00720 [Armatimonadetes bacterium]|nr:hypothetical protein [Armatimonadota bacterium]
MSVVPFAEDHRVQIVSTTDLNSAAKDTTWVSPRNCQKLAFFVVNSGAAWTSGNATSAVTLKQATNASGAGAKPLDYKFYWRGDGDATAQAGADSYTKIGSDASPATLTLDKNYLSKVFIIQIDPSSLDVANGYDWVCLSMAATSVASTFVQVWTIGEDGRYGGTPAAQLTLKPAEP